VINIESISGNGNETGKIDVPLNGVLYLSVKKMNIGSVSGSGVIQIFSGSGAIGTVSITSFNIFLLAGAVFTFNQIEFETKDFILTSAGEPNNIGKIVLFNTPFDPLDTLQIHIGEISAPSKSVSLSVNYLFLVGVGPKIIDTITIYANNFNFTNGATANDLTFLNGGNIVKNIF